jgi:cytochrome c biogenesis protein CcdA
MAVLGERMQSEIAQKYWELGNAIVAFSVLQMLAFLYSLAKQGFRDQVATRFWLVLVAIAFSAILYMVGVVVCYSAEMTLRGRLAESDPANKVLQHTMWARLGIIGLYSLLGIGVLWFGK